MQLHQRLQRLRVCLCWKQGGKVSSQAQSLVTQERPRPLCTAAGDIAFVEHQVQHRAYGVQTRSALGCLRQLKGLTGQLRLGARDALSDSGLLGE